MHSKGNLYIPRVNKMKDVLKVHFVDVLYSDRLHYLYSIVGLLTAMANFMFPPSLLLMQETPCVKRRPTNCPHGLEWKWMKIRYLNDLHVFSGFLRAWIKLTFVRTELNFV